MWALSNYYTRRQDRETLRLNQEGVGVQQVAFEQAQQVEAAGRQTAADRYRTLLETDGELIGLREKIRATAAVQLANGLIGLSDYFTEANYLTQARLNEQLHRVQLLQAQADLLTTQGGSIPLTAPTTANPFSHALLFLLFRRRLLERRGPVARRLPARCPALRCLGQL